MNEEKANELWEQIPKLYRCPYCHGILLMEQMTWPEDGAKGNDRYWEFELTCMDIGCECGTIYIKTDYDGKFKDASEWGYHYGCQHQTILSKDQLKIDDKKTCPKCGEILELIDDGDRVYHCCPNCKWNIFLGGVN